MGVTVWPSGTTSPGRVTSEFGPRKAPLPGASTVHQGIDLVGFAYNCSPCDGVVTFAQYNGGGGNEVRVTAANGDVFYMKHNASFLVTKGQRVVAGQRVGVMGKTGNVTGVHCHFECHPAGGPAVNPRGYMAAAISHNAPAGGGGTPIPATPSAGSAVGDSMYMTDDLNQTVWLITENGATPLRHPDHIGYFTRIGVPRRDRFYTAEVDIMNAYIREARGDIGPNVWNTDIANQAGVHGAAKDWLMNMSSAVAAIPTTTAQVTLTADQVKTLQATLGATLVAELKKGEDAQTAPILAAIAGVDEQVLATFGLKRV